MAFYFVSTFATAQTPTKQRPYGYLGLPALAFSLHGWQRGYMSFQLCRDLVEKHAFFVFRVKENLLFTVTETLALSMPESTNGFFDSVSDELIRYTNDKSKAIYRLVRFTVNQESYFILTNRQDLTAFQVIMLYAYRWQTLPAMESECEGW
jgi:hypothetical protein